MLKEKEFKQLAIWFIVWRLGLFLVAMIAPLFLAYQPSFPYASGLATYNLPNWLYSWANFDGVHYLTIINRGYFGTGLIQAFFPLFPLLAKATNLIFNNALVAGLILSNILAFGVVVSFYQVSKIFLPKQTWQSLLVLLIFPTSFFLGAFYTESLFLVLVLQCYLATKQNRWWLASLLAGLASATKVVGIFAIVAVVMTYLFNDISVWQISKKTFQVALAKLQKNWLMIMGMTAIGSLGLLGYMFYLQIRYADPLYFLHLQSEFGGGRQESLVLYPQVVWRYIKILLTARPFDLKYFAYVQEAIAGTLGLILIFFSSRKTNLGWLVFCLGAFFLPTLTGTFSSLPRYLIVIWPIYLVITEKIRQGRWRWLYLTVSLLLLILNTILFIQGYWVA